MRFRSHYAPFWLLLEKGYNSILPNHNIVDANENRRVSLVQSIRLLSVLVHTTCSSPARCLHKLYSANRRGLRSGIVPMSDWAAQCRLRHSSFLL